MMNFYYEFNNYIKLIINFFKNITKLYMHILRILLIILLENIVAFILVFHNSQFCLSFIPSCIKHLTIFFL